MRNKLLEEKAKLLDRYKKKEDTQARIEEEYVVVYLKELLPTGYEDFEKVKEKVKEKLIEEKAHL